MSASSSNHTLLSIARDALLAADTIDINEPEAPSAERSQGRFVRLTLEGGTPALIYVSRCYRDEWIVSIALRPTADAEQHMANSAAGPLAGEAFAWGWLNRWQQDGCAIAIERFHDARLYVASSRWAAIVAMLASPEVTLRRAGQQDSLGRFDRSRCPAAVVA